MREVRPRVLLSILLIGSLVCLQAAMAVAQIPLPTDTGGTVVNQDSVDQIEQTATDTVNDTVTGTTTTATDTTKDTTTQVTNTATNTTNTATTTVNNTTTQATNTATNTTNTTNTATTTVNNTTTQATNTATNTTNTATTTVNNTTTQVTNTATNTTNTATNTVNNTATQTTNTVNQTGSTATQTTNNTVNNTTTTVNETVQSPKPKASPVTGTVGTVVGTTVGTTTNVNTGTQDAISALAGPYAGPTGSGTGSTTGAVLSPSAGPADAISAIAATTGGSTTGGLLAASGGVGGASATDLGTALYSSASGGIVSRGVAKRFLSARFLLNWTAILGVSQPSLAILVDAVNDADGDGIYSDVEVASTPGADVNFKVLVTNIGAVNFEIDTVSHSYNGATGAAQGQVCGELTGIMLAPGESLACTFPVADYAPPGGKSLVNTVMAAGFEVGKGARRGASDSDNSTVETLLAGDEVLAVAIGRNLAFTGTDAAKLLGLALVLLAGGGGLLSLARARSRRPVRPIPSESPVELLGWWSAGPTRSGWRRQVGRR